MAFKDYLPFTQTAVAVDEAPAPVAVVSAKGQKSLAKVMKRATLALGMAHSGRNKFEASPYDFTEIIKCIDTDSYAKQAFQKYRELLWKSGWDIVSENPDVEEYVNRRIQYFELVMRKPFQQFLEEMADQLVKFFNVFVVKSRGDLAPYFPDRVEGVGKKTDPIVGFEIIPVETVKIERDSHNRPKKYLQDLEGFNGFGQPKAPEWDADEVVHMYMDRKPGHLFGTPFMTSVTNDVMSLRQVEEDILNLIHQELFPFLTVKVGTETEPADDDEVEQAAEEIAQMRHDGAMVHSERREINVVGSEGNALEVGPYLQHFKERVSVGLGLAPHHLGMMMEGGNRSVTDRLDIALYDKVKVYQRYVAAAIRVYFLNEILLEGGFNPFTREEDRCEFRFREIDIDTLIKVETHTVNLYANDLLTDEEARLRLRISDPLDESKTHTAMTVRLQPDSVVTPKGADGKPKAPQTVDTTPAAAKRGDTQKPSTGGAPNPKNHRRGPGNQVRPQNQHPRRTSPNVRHDDTMDDLVELLDEGEDE